jgi:glycosyltransferase involved in cell wall biosynthesis
LGKGECVVTGADDTVRVLYSFPHRIGTGRICYTAWEQVRGLAAAGASVLVFPASVHRPLPEGTRVASTLARGRLRLPFRAVGQMRALALHDRLVARRLPKLAGEIDIVHTWPLGALETLRGASRLGIPTVLERPNAHTRFAYEVVQEECERLGVALPPDHEHAFNDDVLRKEEAEYELADRLLCPSEFVVETFLERGFPSEKLVRHIYGFDEETFFPSADLREERPGLTMLFVGVAAVRKGLHFALEAWLRSPASDEGSFLIAGDVLPAYGELLSAQLSHPSVHVLGHRTDVANLMRRSDLLVLPSIEEGFGLVCTEALGSGCVPLVSDACTDVCRHLENALVHRVGDVGALDEHITMLHRDRRLLSRLRDGCLRTAPDVTWTAAGTKLLGAYRDVVETVARRRSGDETVAAA